MSDFPIQPVGYDKAGPKYALRDANDYIFRQIQTNDFFKRQERKVTKEMDEATELVNIATEKFDAALERMFSQQARVTEETKKASGKIRDTTQKLSDGLARIEKMANFDRLERYVELLERADKAMSALADLEQSGKLEKIAAAVR